MGYTSGAMFAMQLDAPHLPLQPCELEPGTLTSTQVRIRVSACGVCRTDLHLVDGELPNPMLPVVPGHEVIGLVEARGDGVTELEIGDRVGVPWLGFTCGHCDACLRGRENLCPNAKFTGYTLHGGYAEQLVAEARYCFRIPESFGDCEAAPLMCAGLIGYRALSIADAEQRGERVGLYGFGAAAHILAQLLAYQGREVFAFVRPGDDAAKAFARSLGANWAGDATERSPVALDSALLFAPVGDLVPKALADVGPGGRVVCAGIHMSDIPSFPYRLLWQERQLVSVANLTRRDGDEFLPLVAQARIRTAVTTLPLSDANQALTRLRNGEVEGALVLRPPRG